MAAMNKPRLQLQRRLLSVAVAAAVIALLCLGDAAAAERKSLKECSLEAPLLSE